MTLESKVREITPDLARTWLKKIPETQRNLDQNYVNAFALAMKRGEWKTTHQGIAFDVNGFLMDGQHRLAAIEQSGIMVKMMVTYGLPTDYELALDGGRMRTLVQHARYHGKSYKARDFAIARILELGFSAASHRMGSRCVPEDQFTLIEKYLGGIEFATQNIPTKPRKSIPSPVLAVIARASYSQNKERLIEFLHALYSGEIKSEKDTAALRLRDYIQANRSGSWSAREELYKKSEAALVAFIAKRPLKILGRTDIEHFELTPKLLKGKSA
jgi:hypothetical protein